MDGFTFDFVQPQAFSPHIEVKVGTGFGENKEMEKYIKEQIDKGNLVDGGGVMRPGASVFFRTNEDASNQTEISKMTVDEFIAKAKEFGFTLTKDS